MGRDTAIEAIETRFYDYFFTVMSIPIIDFKRALKKVENILKPFWQ